MVQAYATHDTEINHLTPQPSWKVQFVPSEHFQFCNTARKYAGCELTSCGLLAKTCGHPVSLRMIHSEVTYKNTLILTSLPSIFSAVKLTFLKEKLCPSLLTTSSAYRKPCMVMLLKKQRTTGSHHFLHGKVQFDPSVYFQCYRILQEIILCVNLPIGVR